MGVREPTPFLVTEGLAGREVVVGRQDVPPQGLRRAGVVGDEELPFYFALEYLAGRRVARDQRVFLPLPVVLLGLGGCFVESRDRHECWLSEDGDALVPSTVVVAPRPDHAIQQRDVQVAEFALLLGDATTETVLDLQAVVDDATRALGVFQGAFLVADDAEHRVARLAVVGVEDARGSERLGQRVVGGQREKAVPDDHLGVDAPAEPVGHRVGVGDGCRRAVERDRLDHTGASRPRTKRLRVYTSLPSKSAWRWSPRRARDLTPPASTIDQ